MSRFFDVFLFEDLPAADCRADEVYLTEVERCDIYLALFGNEYGWEDASGLSPTHREFNAATESAKERLIFVKGVSDSARHPKMLGLIRTAGNELIRRRFSSNEDLIAAVYASLIKVLETCELIRFAPFDASYCRNATFDDLNFEKIGRFLGLARRGRSFPLPEDTPPQEVLAHLNLLDNNRPTHAAILLFGKQPQRFLLTSEVKCAHFHGTEVSKPIPSYQVYKGTLFELVDQAKDFVLSKIDFWVGTRAESVQVPTAYEIPQEVISEAIVNAIAHRDYTSNASVQVMLFKDRLEIWNPGSLPVGMTLEKLRGPHASVPPNPFIAEPLYLTKYIERMGTGIKDMIDRCRKAGLPEPEIRIDGGSWVTTVWRKKAEKATQGEHPRPESRPESRLESRPESWPESWPKTMANKILSLLYFEKSSKSELSERTGVTTDANSLKQALYQLLDEKLIAYTIPSKPNSRLQKYRLTDKGRALLDKAMPK